MSLLRRTPLAWRQVIHRPMRLVAALAGVSFANVLTPADAEAGRAVVESSHGGGERDGFAGLERDGRTLGEA